MGLNPCFWKSYHHILMHFVHQFQCFELFLIFFFQKLCFSSNFVSLCQSRLIQSIFQSIEILLKLFKEASICFDWSNLFLDQSKLFWNCFKNFEKLLSILINQNCFFDQLKLVNQVFKKPDLTCSNHFFKTFSKLYLSLRLGKAPQRIVCRFPPNLLLGFSLHKPVCPYYPSFCIVFHDFMHYFMVFG